MQNPLRFLNKANLSSLSLNKKGSSTQNPVSPFKTPPFLTNKFFTIILVTSVVLGTSTGFLLSRSSQPTTNEIASTTKTPKNAGQDARTFRDFAEGTLQKKPIPKDPTEYTEGTHLLVRDGAVPVALTSSVVDLNQYEGKKVKIFGETQKAIKEGWLMDVGKVEEK